MIEQRTEEWFAERRGKVTASRIADVMARTKTGYGASRANYMAQLVAERLTGTTAESYTNAAMQWGIDNEAAARENYSAYAGKDVEEVGFIIHPEIADSGASPDGLVGTDGMVEIKCPNTATHIQTLLTQKIDRRYLLQMQWQMACAERVWCDFVSYDPRMPARMQFWCQRVERDDDLVSEAGNEVLIFLEELDDTVTRLLEMY